MVMTLTLIKGCAVNGTSYATNKASLDAQLSYFNSFPFKTYNVNTTRLGEPIRLGVAYNEIMGYNYGYIDYGDGFKYFLSVTGASMITESQTEIQYEIDAYETLCNQGGLSFNRAYMTKYPVERGDVHLSSEPYTWVDVSLRGSSSGAGIIALVTEEGKDAKSNTNTVVINTTNDTSFISALLGHWMDYYSTTEYYTNKLLPSDIYFIGAVPFPIGDFSKTGFINRSTDAGMFDIWSSSSRRSIDITSQIGFTTISSTLYRRGRILDMRGNPVWECPIGMTYTVDVAKISISASACNVLIRLVSGNDSVMVAIPCEIVDVFDDSWKEYLYRQRDTDKAIRNIGYDQNAVSGIASSLTGAIGGSVAGSMSALGGGLGATLGVGTGIISSATNWAIQKYYDPKLQEQYDRQSQRAMDPLLLSGNCTEDMYYYNYAGLAYVEPDSRSKLQMVNEDSEFGYSTVLYLDSDPRIYNSQRLTGPMRGSVDISADAPREWLDQIASRFDSGIRFI